MSLHQSTFVHVKVEVDGGPRFAYENKIVVNCVLYGRMQSKVRSAANTHCACQKGIGGSYAINIKI